MGSGYCMLGTEYSLPTRLKCDFQKESPKKIFEDIRKFL
jgi:hypothetical protein